jgi:hypothetical protein
MDVYLRCDSAMLYSNQDTLSWDPCKRVSCCKSRVRPVVGEDTCSTSDALPCYGSREGLLMREQNIAAVIRLWSGRLGLV